MATEIDLNDSPGDIVPTVTPPKRRRTSERSSPSPKEDTTRHPTGTIVRKRFNDGKYYEGEVFDYDSENQYYRIKFLDGDVEDFDEDDMRKYKKKRQKYANAKAPTASNKAVATATIDPTKTPEEIIKDIKDAEEAKDAGKIAAILKFLSSFGVRYDSPWSNATEIGLRSLKQLVTNGDIAEDTTAEIGVGCLLAISQEWVNKNHKIRMVEACRKRVKQNAEELLRRLQGQNFGQLDEEKMVDYVWKDIEVAGNDKDTEKILAYMSLFHSNKEFRKRSSVQAAIRSLTILVRDGSGNPDMCLFYLENVMGCLTSHFDFKDNDFVGFGLECIQTIARKANDLIDIVDGSFCDTIAEYVLEACNTRVAFLGGRICRAIEALALWKPEFAARFKNAKCRRFKHGKYHEFEMGDWLDSLRDDVIVPKRYDCEACRAARSLGILLDINPFAKNRKNFYEGSAPVDPILDPVVDCLHELFASLP